MEEAAAILDAVEGFTPDTASYDATSESPSGWSPEDVATLNGASTKVFLAMREQIARSLTA
jgi:hypothetical protein